MYKETGKRLDRVSEFIRFPLRKFDKLYLTNLLTKIFNHATFYYDGLCRPCHPTIFLNDHQHQSYLLEPTTRGKHIPLGCISRRYDYTQCCQLKECVLIERKRSGRQRLAVGNHAVTVYYKNLRKLYNLLLVHARETHVHVTSL